MDCGHYFCFPNYLKLGTLIDNTLLPFYWNFTNDRILAMQKISACVFFILKISRWTVAHAFEFLFGSLKEHSLGTSLLVLQNILGLIYYSCFLFLISFFKCLETWLFQIDRVFKAWNIFRIKIHFSQIEVIRLVSEYRGRNDQTLKVPPELSIGKIPLWGFRSHGYENFVLVCSWRVCLHGNNSAIL